MVSNGFGRVVLSGVTLTLAASACNAHEVWILTPAEIEALAAAPMPTLFMSHLWLSLAATICILVSACALRAEDRLGHRLEDAMRPLTARALEAGPLVLRLSVGAMLGLAALGGLPRHGVAPWTTPTFLVPDMPLTLVPGWEFLAPAQFAVALLLCAGLAVRACGIALVLFSGIGLALFGPGFLSYTPHFAAPGLVLALTGGGAMSLDRLIGTDHVLRPPAPAWQFGWRLAQALIGIGFIYLAVAFKLFQPTLIIAILEHGNMPTLGLSVAVVALIMTGVEITAGVLIAMGRLIRPLAAVLIGAMSFLALVLGETPLFHANLYGMMIFFLLAGPRLPVPAAHRSELREAGA